MQISVADYSALRNAQAERGNSEANIYAQRANEVKSITSSIQSLANTAASVVDKVKTEQTKLQETEKSRYNERYNTLVTSLDNTFKSSLTQDGSVEGGKTFWQWDDDSKTTGKAVFATSYTDMFNSINDDIDSRTDLSKQTKQYFKDQLKAHKDALDAQVQQFSLGLDIQTSSNQFNSDANTGYQQWLTTGDRSYLTNVLDKYGVTGQMRATYESTYDLQYQTDLIKENVYNLAKSQGADAAINYIESGKYGDGISVALSRNEKDDLADYARKTSKATQSDLETAATNTALESLKNGQTFSEIYKNAQTPGLSASNQKVINDAIAKVQEDQCVQWWNKASADIDTYSVSDLEKLSTELENNKSLFTGYTDDNGKTVGGAEAQYNTVKKQIAAAKKTALNTGDNEVNTSIKTAVTSSVDSYLIGTSGEDCVNNLISYVSELTDGNADAIQYARVSFLKEIAGKVPTKYKQVYDNWAKNFQSNWLSKKGLSKYKDEYADAYNADYAYALGAAADLFMDKGDMTPTELKDALSGIMNSFVGKYLDTSQNYQIYEHVKGVTTASDAQNVLLQFETNNPVYFDQAISQEIWAGGNSSTGDQFSSMYNFYRDQLKGMGFAIDMDQPPTIFNPDNRNTKAIPIFRTTDGQSLTIDPYTNNVVAINERTGKREENKELKFTGTTKNVTKYQTDAYISTLRNEEPVVLGDYMGAIGPNYLSEDIARIDEANRKKEEKKNKKRGE